MTKTATTTVVRTRALAGSQTQTAAAVKKPAAKPSASVANSGNTKQDGSDLKVRFAYTYDPQDNSYVVDKDMEEQMCLIADAAEFGTTLEQQMCLIADAAELGYTYRATPNGNAAQLAPLLEHRLDRQQEEDLRVSLDRATTQAIEEGPS